VCKEDFPFSSNKLRLQSSIITPEKRVN